MPVYDPKDYTREESDRPRIEFLGPGRHRVTVKDHETGESSGGYAQLTVTFADSRGAQIRGYLIYEGRAAFQLAALLSAVGWSDPINPENTADVRKAIYGKTLQIVVEENDKGKSQIKYYNKVQGGDKGAVYDKHNLRERHEEPPSRTGGGWRDSPPDDGAPPPDDTDIPF